MSDKRIEEALNTLSPQQSIVFSDLDGCLLNHDYTYQEALPALQRLAELEVPLVLASSKTEAEMLPIAEEVGTQYPLICENGGVISWRGFGDRSESRTIVGTPRQQILEHLSQLKEQYRFRSFATLGIPGICEVTGQHPEQAGRAAERQTNEPLQWEDDEAKLDEFRQQIESHNLSLTRGGRFWHVAGHVNKGDGLQTVLNEFADQSGQKPFSLAIGDSPIDLPMLELVDLAIVIPGFDREIKIQPQNTNVYYATEPGSTGWNTSLLKWMDQFTA